MIKRIFLLFACFAFAAPSAFGQSDSGLQPEPDTPDRKTCYLRGWLFPNSKDAAVLRLRSDPQDVQQIQQVLSSCADGALSADGTYAKTSAGSLIAEVVDQNQAPLATHSVRLRPSIYYTLVAWQDKNGKWSIKSFTDSPSSTNAARKPVRVLNFAAGRETLLEVPGSEPFLTGADSCGETECAAKLLGITLKVLDPKGGAPAQSSTEIDLGSMPTAYVLVAPDYRGRMRPRVMSGGEASFDESESEKVSRGGP
jgi:hypothetical protein